MILLLFLFRITDFVLMLHSLMFEVTYNVVLLVLVFLFAWKGKCRCNTDVRHTFLLAWWGGKGMYIKYFHLKIPSLFVLCSLLTSCVAQSVKCCVRRKRKKLHDDKHQLLQQMTSAMHRSVARIIFWFYSSQHSCNVQFWAP